MSAKRLGFTWWPKDWAASQKVQSMNIIERGIYRELIDLVMDAEGTIPVNKTLWARLWRISETELNTAIDYLIELGAVELHGAELWIPSCEPRLGSTMKTRDTARENGKLGGRPPKEAPQNNPTITQEEPNNNPTGLQQKHKQQPKQKPKHKQTPQADEIDFYLFWNLYAKKVDLTKCQKKWQSINNSTRQLIIEHVPKYVASKPDKQFRKNPLTYLNGQCWLDEIESEATPAKMTKAEYLATLKF